MTRPCIRSSRSGAVARPSGRASNRGCSKKRSPLRSGYCPAFLSLFLALGVTTAALAQTKPDKDYLVYVVSESADKIALVRFGPGGARVDHDLPTGDM